MSGKISIEQYLKKVALFAGNGYGTMVRGQFADPNGQSELAMLVSPTLDELNQLEKAVSAMSKNERENAAHLSDSRVAQIAADCSVDPAVFAIFINGFALYCKRVL